MLRHEKPPILDLEFRPHETAKKTRPHPAKREHRKILLEHNDSRCERIIVEELGDFIRRKLDDVLLRKGAI